MARQGRSWMSPDAKKSALIYAGIWTYKEVEVFAWPGGALVGKLTGFDEPYGGCVDVKGDVYLTNLGAGTVFEFAHGGTKVLKTYTPGGEPVGCSVDAAGDLAVTSYDPGVVTVYAGGNPDNAATYTDPDCAYQATMGYDNKGNLIGAGENQGVSVCALLAGAKAETTLKTVGIKISLPAGTMWDGGARRSHDDRSGSGVGNERQLRLRQ